MPTPNPGTRREHKGSAAVATLTASMSISDLNFSISTNTGWPTGSPGPFYVVIDPGTGSEEKVLCELQSAGICTVTSGGRGADDSTAKAHQIGARCYPVWTAAEADELNEHMASIAGVHGVAGNVVGTSDTQTLTNKTISSASNTVNVSGGAIDTVLAAKQPLATKLTNLAAMSTNPGLVVQTGADSFIKRVLTATDNTIAITNPAGTAGEINLAVNESFLSGIPQAGVTNLVTDLAAKVPLSETSITNSMQAASTSALTLTTTAQDVPGATVTFTTVVPNTVVVVHGVFDVNASNTTSTDVAVGTLDVDGATQGIVAIFSVTVPGVTSHRFTAAQTWRVTLAAAGSHTLKLRASKNTNLAGSYSVQQSHTTITVLGRF